MYYSYVYSTGSYLPENTIANEDLTQFPPSAAALIEKKTGVRFRRHAAPDQCTSDLAAQAALNCIEKCDLPVGEIDVIIVATSSPDRILPATATRVQDIIGATNAFAFDINSVCSGSTYGIFLADSIIKSGMHQTVLLIGADLYSRLLNRKDFSTFPYFGDGAGALLLIPGTKGDGILHSCLETDGGGHDVIRVPAGGSMMPFDCIEHERDRFFRMDGKQVFSFAVERGSQIIVRLLEETGFRTQDIDCFIAHQANINIIRMIAENINAIDERFFVNIAEYGNTAGASVLIALDEAIENGALKRGDLAVTVAFGGGLSWGANLISY